MLKSCVFLLFFFIYENITEFSIPLAVYLKSKYYPYPYKQRWTRVSLFSCLISFIWVDYHLSLPLYRNMNTRFSFLLPVFFHLGRLSSLLFLYLWQNNKVLDSINCSLKNKVLQVHSQGMLGYFPFIFTAKTLSVTYGEKKQNKKKKTEKLIMDQNQSKIFN